MKMLLLHRSLSFSLLLAAFSVAGQVVLPVNYTIYPNATRKQISPLIYGSNGQSDDTDENITGRRLGGNRLTGYNWEINASNAGSDYLHSSDSYLLNNIPNSSWNTPGIVTTTFHDESKSLNAYSLITLQMAGYVSADFNGSVASTEKAPSSRWVSVLPVKGSAFSLSPNTSDASVYMDEYVNYLVNKYGTSTTTGGIKAYALDNEPALWQGTHPYLHPSKPTMGELYKKSVALSAAVKSVDPNAEIYGLVSYGFNETKGLQGDPQFAAVQSTYKTYANAFLSKMKKASDSVGYRLLDVLDVHWYPETRGKTSTNVTKRVVFDCSESGDCNDKGMAQARMQAPRTLWDSTFRESSWIVSGSYYSYLPYIQNLQKGIDTHYSGTKLGFSEFYFGGASHISGGITTADVLGVYGKYGIYFASHWNPLDNYVSSAYRLYRNYDGKKSTFGNLSIGVSNSNRIKSSAFGAISSVNSTERIHFIVLNKCYDTTITANISISSNSSYTRGAIYGFTSTSAGEALSLIDTISSISSNTFSYSLPPLSAYHFVLYTNQTVSGITDNLGNRFIMVYPNPTSENIKFVLPSDWAKANIVVQNATGGQIHAVQVPENEFTWQIPSEIVSGIYFVNITHGSHYLVEKVIISR